MQSSSFEGNPNYGIISPAEHSAVEPGKHLKITFNPGRYFKETALSIDVFIVDDQLGPKSGKIGEQVASEMKPNTDIELGPGLPKTAAYDMEIDLSKLTHKHPGPKTLLIKENYIPYGEGSPTGIAFWATTFHVLQ